ncbi:MAG: TlpA disulfide reductase family protein [Verrucomicrobiota bacterium]
MKTVLILLIIISTIQLSYAQDFSFSFEGDAAKRERLTSLQDNASPPEWKLSGWQNSSPLSLEELKGKIIVLDFWATWCGPCIASIPHTNQIHEKYKNDVVIIGVCHPKGSEKMNDVAKEYSISYPIAVDKSGDTIRTYKVNGYPDYYIFDRTGKLVVADCSNSKVDEVLTKLINKK